MLRTEMHRLLKISLRQPIEFFLGLFLLTLIFFGVRSAAAYYVGSGVYEFSTLSFGFLAWVVINNVASFVHGEVSKDIKSGVFEVLFLRPGMLEQIIVARAIYAALHSVLVAGGLRLFFSLFSGSIASFMSPKLYMLIFLGVAWGIPVSLFAASLSIVSRQTGAIIVFLHLIIALLLVAPAFASLSYLPYLLPVSSLTIFVRSGSPLAFGFSCISSVCWLVVAVTIWRAAKRIAIRRGSIDPWAYL